MQKSYLRPGLRINRGLAVTDREESPVSKKNSARVKTREYNLFHTARTKVLLGIADDEARKMSIRETTPRNITC